MTIALAVNGSIECYTKRGQVYATCLMVEIPEMITTFFRIFDEIVVGLDTKRVIFRLLGVSW
ncbi:MAG: hypothetical protein KME64_17385 [Scytonematopsis contorta HA4267-MV1]|nr:hypothetical protein [Scytonematopsis contorta HA4267-MV1]